MGIVKLLNGLVSEKKMSKKRSYEYIPVPIAFTKKVDMLKVMKGKKSRQEMLLEITDNLDPLVEDLFKRGHVQEDEGRERKKRFPFP